MIIKGTLEVTYPFPLCYETIKDALFKCPRTQQEVTLEQNCIDADGRGTPCLFYQHWGWTGAHPYLACGYKQPPEEFSGEVPEASEEEIDEPETDTPDHRKRGFELDTET